VCSPNCTDPGHVFQENSGEIWIEAEHYNSTSSLSGGNYWNLQTNGSTSGGEYMRNLPTNASCSSGSTTCGAELSFDFEVTQDGRYWVSFFYENDNSSSRDHVQWSVDGIFTPNWNTTNTNSYIWRTDNSYIDLLADTHELKVWLRDGGFRLDKIRIKRANSQPGNPSGFGQAEDCQSCTTPACDPPICNNVCKAGGGACASDCMAGVEWPECGTGQECCGAPGSAVCAQLGTCGASTVETATGETWSKPVFGRVSIAGSPTWVVFFGSGYDNVGSGEVGRSLYMLNAATGVLLGRWDIDDLNFHATSNPSTIDNTVPAGPGVADIDGDGDLDAVYVGDLEGRLWRLDTSVNATLSGGMVGNWSLTTIFDAGSPGGVSDRIWAPIVTTPAVSVLNGIAHVYFGTGGDDRAPAEPASGLFYRFYSVADLGNTTRFDTDLSPVNLEWTVEGPAQHKFWSDPTIANNTAVYFASLPGTIESADPCTDLGSSSLVYGYAIRKYNDKSGALRQPGQALFSPISSTSKIRQQLLIRGATGYARSIARPADIVTAGASDVLIQEFSGDGNPSDAPAIRRLTEVGSQVSAQKRMRVISWREVPLS